MKIHLGGSRTVLPGFINVDKYLAMRKEVVPEDCVDFMARQEAGVCDELITKHMIEHLPKARAEQLIGECFRVMCKGGRLYIECPDLDVEIASYQKNPGFITSIFGLQRHGGDFHLWGYTPATLRDLLERHGFTVKKVGHCPRPGSPNSPSLFIEGEKP